jgi:hypothetical protein
MITIPEVGMGATICVGSDRYPATIIQVTSNGKRIVVQEDKATRIDNNGFSEQQEYIIQPDLNGTIHIASLRKDGRYREVGGATPITIGARGKYYDFSY